MENTERDFGLCPVCGHGHIIKTNRDYVCTNRLKPSDSGSCRFSLPFRSHGVDLTDDIVRQLVKTGRTDKLTLCDQKGFPYQGCFVIEKGKGYVIESERKSINAVCPDCGGKIVMTRFGYACEDSLKVDPTCHFNIPNFICNRFITPQEAEDFCKGTGDILDSFLNKNSNWFSAYLTRLENGDIALSSVVGKCPVCGGNLLVGATAFNCSNFKNGCDFKIWRHYYGHKVNLKEVRDLLENGRLTVSFDGYDRFGHVHELILQIGQHNEIQVTSNL